MLSGLAESLRGPIVMSDYVCKATTHIDKRQANVKLDMLLTLIICTVRPLELE